MKHCIQFFAGLFEGEGCVMIRKSTPSKTGRVYYRLCTTIASTTKPMLTECHERFGGSLYPGKKYKDFHTQPWMWVLACDAAAKFLEEIQPYSIIKRHEIDAALEFQAHVRRCNGGLGRSYRRLPDGENEYRERAYWKLRELKPRGHNPNAVLR